MLNADSAEKHNFMIAATRWTMSVSQHKRGHPDLHKKFGLAFWKGMLICFLMCYFKIFINAICCTFLPCVS